MPPRISRPSADTYPVIAHAAIAVLSCLHHRCLYLWLPCDRYCITTMPASTSAPRGLLRSSLELVLGTSAVYMSQIRCCLLASRSASCGSCQHFLIKNPALQSLRLFQANALSVRTTDIDLLPKCHPALCTRRPRTCASQLILYAVGVSTVPLPCRTLRTLCSTTVRQ